MCFYDRLPVIVVTEGRKFPGKSCVGRLPDFRFGKVAALTATSLLADSL